MQIQVRDALESLTIDEIREAVRLLRAERGLAESVRFARVELLEPPKEHVLTRPAAEIERMAFAVLYDKASRQTFEAVVSLDAGVVREWRHIPGVQPPYIGEEYGPAEEAIKASPLFREAMARRGVVDMELVQVDPWSAGYYGDEAEVGRRLTRAYAWVRHSPTDNGYAHPVEGVVVLLDIDTLEVLAVEDHGVAPIPRASGNYSRRRRRRDPIRPEAARDHPATGAELRDRRVARPLAEVALPDRLHRPRGARAPHRRLRGRRPSPADPPPRLDRGDGRPVRRPGADAQSQECLRRRRVQSGRLRQLARARLRLPRPTSTTSTRRWPTAPASPTRSRTPSACTRRITGSSGSTSTGAPRPAKCAGRAGSSSRSSPPSATTNTASTGISTRTARSSSRSSRPGSWSTGAVPPGVTPAHGQLLNRDGLYAPIHQHFFSIRLDMDVDGTINRLVEVNTEAAPPGPENPQGNAFRAVPTPLASESAAQRVIDPLAARHWRVVNPDVAERVSASRSPTR